MPSTDEPQVKAYLSDLERALGALPRDRRTEVLRDIRAHIADALADGDSNPVTVASVLESLGSPQEIADAAYEESPSPAANWPDARAMAGRDIAAVILVLIGGFLWGIGWFAGVILLWTSPTWRTRDKWIGTLVLPGGLVTPLVLGGLAFATTRIAGPCATPAAVFAAGDGGLAIGPSRAAFACGPDGGLPSWVGIAVAVVAFAAPFFTTYWLIRTARRPR
ncbi:MAG: hypothetical protein QOG52_727 [Frankiaceae bacterium]|nr:hypothetical protein [Frankiaceae bacterium]